MRDCDKAFKWLESQKKTYQPVEGYLHKIDPERVKGFEEILSIIVKHVGEVYGKHFMDIGCNVGYFTLELGKLGATAIGYEMDSRRVGVARCLAENNGLTNVAFTDGNAVEHILAEKPKCDYALVLNVIHHLFVQNEAKTWEMFNYLIDNSQGVFVMTRNQLKTWKLCDKRDQIPASIITKSHATSFIDYGVVHGRNLYLFSNPNRF